MNQESLFGTEGEKKPSGPVECLGMTFESDEARRAHFTELLREKLQDPEFRSIEGFPIGTDEAILELSDPPYYTACPNPWLTDFIDTWELAHSGGKEVRNPFSVDISVGKGDALYKAHSYHTKVPHLAIVPSILHYTNPGDTVLDGFCGSGMTASAVNACNNPDSKLKNQIESTWSLDHIGKPDWGGRNVIVNDLSPAATFISSSCNLPFDVSLFEREARNLLSSLKQELGWMYSVDGINEKLDYVVWGEAFSCPECASEFNFMKEAFDESTLKVRESFTCPGCSKNLTKRNCVRVLETDFDESAQNITKKIKLIPTYIAYKDDGVKCFRELSRNELAILERIKTTKVTDPFPDDIFPIDDMYHGSRLAPKGFQNISSLFTKRALLTLSRMWAKTEQCNSHGIRRMLKFFVEQSFWTMSVLNRYRPTGFSQVNQYMTGIYYVPSQHAEPSPWYVLEGKLNRLVKTFSDLSSTYGQVLCSTGSTGSLLIKDDSIDYIFTDPPFGENIFYADLNLIVESWHGVKTSTKQEAIIDKAKNKELLEYQHLMKKCLSEYYRVLKPNKWITIVFSNSRASVWNAIQVALQQAGFVVAEVTALDKKQGSYRQVTSATAVKQDLVISAYKPSNELEENFGITEGNEAAVWDFVEAHLDFLPIVKVNDGEISIMPERSAKVLFDRTVAWFIKHNKSVPLSATEFQKKLFMKFSERDSMFFLVDQVAVYDKKRSQTQVPTQLNILVENEITTIEWLKQILSDKPMTQQDIQPIFLREITSWNKNEKPLELGEILEHNLIKYDGKDDVPSQIHTYLSTNFKDMRGLDKSDPKLVAKAKDRWYVPDPNKAADLEKVRLRALLKEFETYKTEKKKIKQPRGEALRAGFNTAWEAQDFQTILDISAKIPPAVLQEDEKLLMFYDNALTLTSTEDDEW